MEPKEKLCLLAMAEPLHDLMQEDINLSFLSAFGKGEVETEVARLLYCFIQNSGREVYTSDHDYWLDGLDEAGYVTIENDGYYPTEKLIRYMLDNIEKIRAKQKWQQRSSLQWWRCDTVAMLVHMVVDGDITEDEANDYLAVLIDKYGQQDEFDSFKSNLDRNMDH